MHVTHFKSSIKNGHRRHIPQHAAPYPCVGDFADFFDRVAAPLLLKLRGMGNTEPDRFFETRPVLWERTSFEMWTGLDRTDLFKNRIPSEFRRNLDGIASKCRRDFAGISMELQQNFVGIATGTRRR